MLENELTTESLLQKFYNQKSLFLGNVEIVEYQLKELKNKNLIEHDGQCFTWEDTITVDGQIIENSVKKNEQNQNKVLSIIQQIPQQKSHLKGKIEEIYKSFKIRDALIQASQLLSMNRKVTIQEVSILNDTLKSLGIQSSTLNFLSTIKSQYDTWECSITNLFYKNQIKDLEKQILQYKQFYVDPVDLLNKRISELTKIFENIPHYHIIMQALSQKNVSIIDESKFRQDVRDKYTKIKQLFENPQISEQKPLLSLLKIICYLATQPFKLDPKPLLEKYAKSVMWEIRVKEFIGEKDAWENLARDLPCNQQCEQIGEIPPDVFWDKDLIRLACQKSEYIKQLKIQCKIMLEIQDEMPIPELEQYIVQCKAVCGLDYEISKVQQKIDLMAKVLSLTMASGGDQNYEELLQSVMTEVYQGKLQRIHIPQGLETMLEGKVQIIEELRCEFNQTLNRCADSFNKIHITELRKILTKAKDHKLQMEKEKKILECLPKSEDWFIQTFAKLKQMCGPQLHQIDFKDYSQLHSVIKSQKDCDLLLRLPPNIKPENLVAAARNLYESLQGAKWVFEVRSLMQGGTEQQRELSHLLMLYYKAKELQISLSYPHPEEFILTDDEPNQQIEIITEFEQLAQNAVEFDTMFGTHQKVIATLEKFEQQGQLQSLIETVDRIQNKLVQIKESTKCQISPAAELEVLQKVRTYISLNEDYQVFILAAQQNKSEQHMEIDQDQKKQTKISYQKALKLQRQAREGQIPDDIPVLRRLNQSVLKFEKFRRECSDYFRFRQRIEQKGYQIQSYAPKEDKQDDQIYNLKFVKRLLDDSESLEIEIPTDTFDFQQLKKDLAVYENWQQQAEHTLKKLESELQRKSDLSLQGDTVQQFNQIKEEVSKCPVFNQDLFMKIQAFDWVYNMSKLLNDQAKSESGQIYNLQYWKSQFDQHLVLLPTLPILKGHPILQRILWEIDQAKIITEFVKNCKTTQRSLSGKYVQMQRGTGADNYMVFKNKHTRDKLDRHIDQASRCKVDIQQEISDLSQWASQHDRYTQMGGSLWQQGYEKVQTIQRNIFQSPIDFGNLYFDIEKRLKIAEEIRTDLKQVFEEVLKSEKRIKISRVTFALEHFSKNCEITQIPEVQRIQKQIKVSQDVLEKCEEMIEQENPDLNQLRNMIQNQIVIDLESDEMPLKKELFEKTVNQIDRITFAQFKLLEKDYLKLKHQFLKAGLQFNNQKFDLLRQQADTILQKIKVGDFQDVYMHQVDFENTIIDKQAQIYAYNRQQTLQKLGQTQLAPDESINELSDQSMQSQTSSDKESSSSSSKNSIDSSSDEDAEMSREGGEDEMTEQKQELTEEIGLAPNRDRRQLKPNMMDDHIYFVKKPVEQTESRQQIREKRQAKEAAKQFEKQKIKAQRQLPKIETSLEMAKFSLAGDDEVCNSINQMKQRIRNQSQTSIQNSLKQVVQTEFVKSLSLEIEELVATKYTQIDQQYRSKIQDVCRNIEQLKLSKEIAELYFVKKTQPLQKLLNSQINFNEQFEKALYQRKLELRKLQKSQPQKEQPKQVMFPQRFGMMQMAPRPQLPVKVKTIEIQEETKRKNSADSVESLQSNPAQFSDDEGGRVGYDPTQVSIKPMQNASFLYPPPGVSLPQFSYNPTLSLIQISQSNKNQQKELILYDPIAHSGNQPIQLQQQRVTLARPGSLLKVYDGCLDVQQKDSQFNLTIWSFQDVRLFQKLPQPLSTLSLKGKSSLKEVCDHFLKVQQDPQAGQLLKGYAQRTSYLNGEQSERYQKFYDSMEQTGRVAVFNLFEGVSIYFIPISKQTRDFVKLLGIQTDSSHLNQNSTKKIDFETETHKFAWVSQIRSALPVRSNQIWNPQVIKSLPALEIITAPVTPAKDTPNQSIQTVKYSSPITSEEPSYESVKQKKRVEINLIQPATIAAVKAEQTEMTQQKLEAEEDDIDIDAIIARFRQNGETDIEATLQPIIHKLIGQKNKEEKLEAFLKEVIAKNKTSKMQVKQEPYGIQKQPVAYQQAYNNVQNFQQQGRFPQYMAGQDYNQAPQQHHYMHPPHMSFAGIRPPMPMPVQPYQQMQPGMHPGMIQPQNAQHFGVQQQQFPAQQFPGQPPVYRPPPVRYAPPGQPGQQQNQQYPAPYDHQRRRQ